MSDIFNSPHWRAWGEDLLGKLRIEENKDTIVENDYRLFVVKPRSKDGKNVDLGMFDDDDDGGVVGGERKFKSNEQMKIQMLFH